MAYNSDNFNLGNWKLAVPVDSNGTTLGVALEIPNLAGYESAHFYDAPDGAMVFRADVDGATTSGSKYARSELREMNGSQRAAWKLSEGGTMTATVKVDQVPTATGSTPSRLIVGQIHGADEELIRLYWENNSVHFMNDQAGPDNKEMKFTFKNDAGQAPAIAVGETFSYKIDARGDTLTVDIHADGQVYSSVSKINSVWQSDTFYFKAGVYMGINETSGTGSGQVSFYGLDFGHAPGAGLAGLPAVVTPPVEPPPVETPPVEPPPPVYPAGAMVGTASNDTTMGTHAVNLIYGGDGDDKINGRDGNDLIYGENGNDTLYGDWHNDTLEGGAGDDVLDGGYGDDVLIGGTGADKATGGAGRDNFIVARGDGGLTVNDFAAGATGDRIVVKGYALALLATAQLTQTGADAVLLLEDGAQVTLRGVTMANLAEGNLMADIDGTLVAFMPGAVAPPPVEPPPVEPPPVEPPPTYPAGAVIGTSAGDTMMGTHAVNLIYGSAGNDRINGRDGNDRLYGEDGDDTLYGDWHNDYLSGGAGDDLLYGGHGNDTLMASVGADKLYGEDGNDVLNGGAGNDLLSGGAGDDRLEGGDGQDTLTGGGGRDVFVWTKMPDIHDILTDFKLGEDRLDIDALLGQNGLAYLGAASGKTGIYVDADGASGAAQAVLVATFSSTLQATTPLDDLLV